MTVPDAVRRLVERFEEHRQSYPSCKYNEAQLRREFMDPFFKTLRPHASGALTKDILLKEAGQSGQAGGGCGGRSRRRMRLHRKGSKRVKEIERVQL